MQHRLDEVRRHLGGCSAQLALAGAAQRLRVRRRGLRLGRHGADRMQGARPLLRLFFELGHLRIAPPPWRFSPLA